MVVGCSGRAHTDFSDPPVILQSTIHPHIPDEEHITKKRVKNRLCDADRDTPLIPLASRLPKHMRPIGLLTMRIKFPFNVLMRALTSNYTLIKRWLDRGQIEVVLKIFQICRYLNLKRTSRKPTTPMNKKLLNKVIGTLEYAN